MSHISDGDREWEGVSETTEMCGISVIISGIRIDLSSLLPDIDSHVTEAQQQLLSVDDLKVALRRRGPDSVGGKKVVLYSNTSVSVEGHKVFSFIKGEEENKREKHVLVSCKNRSGCCLSANGEFREQNNFYVVPKSVVELHFIGATLQLRGINPIFQPLVDNFGNILIYNGEIFGGIHVGSDNNDAEILLKSLGECCSCNRHVDDKKSHSCNSIGGISVPEVFSSIKGPWAAIYWQDCSRTMWFGRDAFGRRSLLVHWPNSEDSRLLLSSVAPPSSFAKIFDEKGKRDLNFWEELSCGIYSIHMDALETDGCLVGEVKMHEWTNPMLRGLIKWERALVQPTPDNLQFSDFGYEPAQSVLLALRESVMRRTAHCTNFQAVVHEASHLDCVPVAVLFSGGLDSMILAALLDECLDLRYAIDLLNVSFDGPSAPDRISARAGLKELRRVASSRRWKLVEIDADLSKLTSEKIHVMSLINPATTYMDLNIGIALWLAAGGDGWLYEPPGDDKIDEDPLRVAYNSTARILLVGSGADEQCAGYGRHKTKYRQGSWVGLDEEMRLDMQRIWKRNLGRDDRCISDNGKEARFPFLDEDVIRTFLDIPLWQVANLDQPRGIGDKKILREVANLLGLHQAAVLPKRAIQFGSRVARESNRENFGSNRAANQASAGSAVISRPS